MKRINNVTVILFLSFSLIHTSVSNNTSFSVAAAASLKDVVAALIKEFDKDHNVEVKTSFASTGMLRAQIEQDAPYEVFLAANKKHTDILLTKGLISAKDVNTMCINAISVVIKKSIKSQEGDLTILITDRVKKIAIGSFDLVPAGYYGKILFEKNGIYHDISSKFVFSNNVKQALLWIENGEVDAAVIYHTDFLVAHNINEIYSSFQVGNEKIEYPIALTSRGLKSSVAIQFRDFILSNTGQNIIESFGFLSFDHHD